MIDCCLSFSFKAGSSTDTCIVVLERMIIAPAYCPVLDVSKGFDRFYYCKVIDLL